MKTYNFSDIARGEPIDVSYLAQMSQYINHVNEMLRQDKSSHSSLFNDNAPRRYIDTADVSIWTGKVRIISGSVPKATAERVNWSTSFTGISFKTIPIVTATPFCNSDTGTGPGTVSSSAIWIHEITTHGVKGKWKWLGPNTHQKETVYALVIAIGEGQVA